MPDSEQTLPPYNAADAKRWRWIVGYESVSATDLHHFALIEQAERARIAAYIKCDDDPECPCRDCRLADEIKRGIHHGE